MPRRAGGGAAHFALDIDGLNMGWVRSASGGNAVADVVVEPPDAAGLVNKHLGQVRYDDAEVVAGLDLHAAFYHWIGSSFSGTATRKDGSIVAVDFNYKEVAAKDFFQALVTEVTFPALDAASKDVGLLTVKLSPGYVRYRKGSGAKVSGTASKKAKQWLASNFRVELGDLPCDRVVAVDSFTCKVEPDESHGETRDIVRTPGRMEIPNLRLMIAATDADAWVDWHKSFVIDGSCGPDQELAGSLQFLTPDMKELARLDLSGVGIFRLATDDATADADTVAKVVVDLYCEAMDLTVG
jgi:hypothetical protein